MRALVRVTDWERVSIWRRVLCAFIRVGILLVLVTVLVNAFGPPISIFVTTRMVDRKVPAVKVAPVELSDYSVSNLPGTTLSYFGYEFEVPWNASFKQKAFGKGGLVQLEFASGQNVTFIAPGNQSGLLTEIVQDRSLNMQNLQAVFGDLTNRSAYDQYAALLNTTPQSIRAFGPRAEAVRGVTLLIMKAIAARPGLQTGAFSFELSDKRGFQIGDPQQSKRVDLEVFGMGDQKVEFALFASKSGNGLLQSEINRILKTLHPVGPPARPVSLPN